MILKQPNCTKQKLSFGRLGRRVVEANFNGGDISSDGGLMLLRQIDNRIGLSQAITDAVHDKHDPNRIKHKMQDLIAQRLYAIICGYEDLNDHDQLRNDPLMQTAVGKYAQLGSASTLCRLEGNITRQDIVALTIMLLLHHPK